MREYVPATLENMRRIYRHGLVAWSAYTGEKCSANPADYFYLEPNEPLRDELGNPMDLAWDGGEQFFRAIRA